MTHDARPKSYDYARRRGVQSVTWEQFAALARSLAAQVSDQSVDAILGVARAGLIPAATVAAMLRADLFPISLTRRERDVVVRQRPKWLVDVPRSVAGRAVAVIDDVADSGETLAMASRRALEMGAERVVTASLVCHTWAQPPPDICPLKTDALVIFPWDEKVYAEGEWVPHPEIRAALELMARADSEPEGSQTSGRSRLDK